MHTRVFLAGSLIMIAPVHGLFGRASARDMCRPITVPVTATSIKSMDVYLAPNVETDKIENVRLQSNRKLLAGRGFVKIAPSMSSALLSDNSVITFVRNSGKGNSIENLEVVSRANCVEGKVDFSRGYRQNGPNEIILKEWKTLPTEMLRLENRGGYARLSRVLRFGDRPSEETEVVLPLIISERVIHAFGVSVPSIEGGCRDLMLVTKETDGTLTIANYKYAVRK